MESPLQLNIDPERVARRRAFGLLATAALISALTGLLFVMIWKNYVKGLEPEYFRDQGAQWGEEFQRRVRSQTNRIMASARPFEIVSWPENVDSKMIGYFEEEFRRNPSLRPRQVALMFRENGGPFRTGRKLGKDLSKSPLAKDFHHHTESGLDIAVVDSDNLVAVVVEGPVKNVGEEIGNNLKFRLITEFRSFNSLTGKGTSYAVLLVISYLAIIYFLFIQVFRLGRRQMKLALSAKEKSIRLKAISSVAEGIAHEVRNPLNAISLNVQYMEKLGQKSGMVPQSGDFQRVYRELGKIRKVIDNFVNFAKSRDLEISKWSMSGAVDASLEDLAQRIEDDNVQINRDDSGNLELVGDRPKITQVLASLIENGMDAMGEAEEKVIDLELTGAPDTVCVAIRNRGETPGDEVMKNMFDPYFTTRSSSLGLGLTLAKTVVDSHGGRIAATAAPGGGLLVTVTLPREF